MLRICYSDTGDTQRWILCGQLAGPWVDELRACWQHARAMAAGSRALIDLSEVTFIDESGERLLCELRRAGAKFVAGGIATKYLLDNLTGKGERPLRRLIRG